MRNIVLFIYLCKYSKFSDKYNHIKRKKANNAKPTCLSDEKLKKIHINRNALYSTIAI